LFVEVIANVAFDESALAFNAIWKLEGELGMAEGEQKTQGEKHNCHSPHLDSKDLKSLERGKG